MLVTFSKFLFVSFCSFYSFPKLINIQFTKRSALLAVLFSIVTAAAEFVFHIYLTPIDYILTVLLMGIFNWIIHKSPPSTVAIFSVISFVLSYFLLILSLFVLMPVVFAVYGIFGNSTYINSSLYTLSYIATFLMIVFLFHIKRFKNGMTFLEEKISNELGIFISVMCLIAFTFTSIKDNSDMILLILAFVILLCGILLIFWWKKRIKDEYIKKVNARTVKSLKQTIQELKKEGDLLRYHNEELSEIIHKDNKIIPAMNMTVRSLLVEIRDEAESNERKSEIEKLLKNLNDMSEERHGIVTSYEDNNTQIRPTGFIMIDAILLYMSKKAVDLSIKFDYAISYNISEIIDKIIDEATLNTLLADLIENAIIAVSFQENSERSVHVALREEDGHFRFDIYDSGIPFQAKTISSLGIKRSTTHADTGGSGIGLMTTYEIIRKANASFIIDECIDADVFTKCISVSFDGLSEIRIKSERTDIIRACKQRNDINLLNV